MIIRVPRTHILLLPCRHHVERGSIRMYLGVPSCSTYIKVGISLGGDDINLKVKLGSLDFPLQYPDSPLSYERSMRQR